MDDNVQITYQANYFKDSLGKKRANEISVSVKYTGQDENLKEKINGVKWTIGFYHGGFHTLLEETSANLQETFSFPEHLPTEAEDNEIVIKVRVRNTLYVPHPSGGEWIVLGEAENSITTDIYPVEPLVKPPYPYVMGNNEKRTPTTRRQCAYQYLDGTSILFIQINGSEFEVERYLLEYDKVEIDMYSIIYLDETIHLDNFSEDSIIKYKLRQKVIDKWGRSIVSDWSPEYQTDALPAASGAYSFSQIKWHPLADKSFELSFPNQSQTVPKITYKITASVGNGPERDFLTFTYPDLNNDKITTSGSTAYYDLTSQQWNLFKKLKVSSNVDYDNLVFYIKLTNSAGDSNAERVSMRGYKLLTKEAPSFPSGATLSLTAGFYDKENVYKKFDQNIDFVNKGDTIRFYLPKKATDLNDTYFDGSNETKKDSISYYMMQYAINLQELSLDSASLQWRDLNRVTFNSSDYAELILPDLERTPNKKNYIYFRVKVVDDTGLFCILPNNTKYRYGRTAAPQFDITNVKTKEEDSKLKENQFTVEFKITDFGGENLDGTNGGYGNFDRWKKGTSFTYQIFSGYNNQSLNQNDFKYIPLGETTKSVTVEFSENITKNFFVRVLVTGYSAPSQGITSGETSKVFQYYKSSATLSGRPHWVGINAADGDYSETDNNVLVIKGFKDRQIIRLEGANSEGKAQTITIDLSNGKISGAVIEGGSWW